MTDTTTKVRAHYSDLDLTDRIRLVLATITPGGPTLTVAQLAPLDQFHTRGILATAELASAAGLEPSRGRSRTGRAAARRRASRTAEAKAARIG